RARPRHVHGQLHQPFQQRPAHPARSGLETARSLSSDRLEGEGEGGPGYEDAAPPPALHAGIARRLALRQGTTVGGSEPEAQAMAFPLRLRPVHVAGAVVKDLVIVQKLDIARLEVRRPL